ncbi:MAG: hypothetical protein WC508_03735 [Patescibacteria group bacterium]
MNTGLEGPFTLSHESIDFAVKLTRPGTYVLGRLNTNRTFIVEYVGRSDTDLNDRLHDWVESYPMFKASYFPSAEVAYNKECEIYHMFGGSQQLDNAIHPDHPDDTDWSCPVSNCYN